MSEHGHDHAPIAHGDEPPAAARVRALEALLVEKGVVAREDVRQGIDWLVSRSPADGARLVARAWIDPGFRERLLADARAAALELGLDPGPSPVVVAMRMSDIPIRSGRPLDRQSRSPRTAAGDLRRSRRGRPGNTTLGLGGAGK